MHASNSASIVLYHCLQRGEPRLAFRSPSSISACYLLQVTFNYTSTINIPEPRISSHHLTFSYSSISKYRHFYCPLFFLVYLVLCYMVLLLSVAGTAVSSGSWLQLLDAAAGYCCCLLLLLLATPIGCCRWLLLLLDTGGRCWWQLLMAIAAIYYCWLLLAATVSRRQSRPPGRC